ncbi:MULTISPECIES: GNAT family N-acetyltransferase [Carnobacterium]|uniref:GNAT family N-acetyltransferase n=1 Tax=Carnobacterium TaxID=2747 RepID=UPI00288C65C8|nr:MULTISPECIES: GNAT family N-acetyltransferase [Carnobacterium]MDT1939631.1 GNAT family N-acetyltransferase [Carnobacterium divergens]MDT1942069.1 GNAT family N-acetyltransferase [Carnobacterium divergens]MDT1947867.1 GNAT family N-acetyltransferase [Carnobacterium divergens]MDT1950355.1 GNAT family N-acetyltransferase [Carnobacterium divergens]MDT1955533.1 GNAT family N-acetyltransferase [Carnobacterium divergens]
MTLEFCICKESDLQTLQKISIETFSDTFKDQNTTENLTTYLEQAYHTEQLRNELNNPDSTFLFLKDKQEIVGYLKVNVNNAQSENSAEEALEVERIYIKKNAKGQGYGRKMIAKAEELANQKKKKQIWLGVWEHNEPARAFYKHLGFVETSEHSFYMGNEKQLDIIMTKKVTEI